MNPRKIFCLCPNPLLRGFLAGNTLFNRQHLPTAPAFLFDPAGDHTAELLKIIPANCEVYLGFYQSLKIAAYGATAIAVVTRQWNTSGRRRWKRLANRGYGRMVYGVLL